MITILLYQLSYAELAGIGLVALLIGMAKTGVNGAGMLAVPLLASIFGGQRSSGILLPMLLLADVLGVWYYHRHASWQHLKILFPWAAVGVIVGTLIGSYFNDSVFKMVMAIIIVVSVIIMLWLEKWGTSENIPKQKSFVVATGIAGGFTSMVGNLAGSVMSVIFIVHPAP